MCYRATSDYYLVYTASTFSRTKFVQYSGLSWTYLPWLFTPSPIVGMLGICESSSGSGRCLGLERGLFENGGLYSTGSRKLRERECVCVCLGAMLAVAECIVGGIIQVI